MLCRSKLATLLLMRDDPSFMSFVVRDMGELAIEAGTSAVVVEPLRNKRAVDVSAINAATLKATKTVATTRTSIEEAEVTAILCAAASSRATANSEQVKMIKELHSTIVTLGEGEAATKLREFMNSTIASLVAPAPLPITIAETPPPLVRSSSVPLSAEQPSPLPSRPPSSLPVSTLPPPPPSIFEAVAAEGSYMSQMETLALKNYETFFSLPTGTATIAQVKATSGGVAGFAGWKPRPAVSAAPSLESTAGSSSSDNGLDTTAAISAEEAAASPEAVASAESIASFIAHEQQSFE